MHDLDELLHARLAQPIEDRQFTLRGYTFTLRASIKPEAMDLFVAISQAPNDVAATKAVRAYLAAVLTDEQMVWWDELRSRDGDDALTITDMLAVCSFALERIVGRPPTRLSPSGETSDETPSTTESKDASRLRVAGSKA